MSPRVPRQQLSVRLGNPPLGVKILTPGSYRDAVDLYRAAESHARSVDSSARVENCAGSTSSVFPFASSVLSPDLLDRISSELTGRSGTTSIPRSEARSPLSVSPSAAERTAVRNVRGLAAELAAELPTPQRSARRPVSGVRSSSPIWADPPRSSGSRASSGVESVSRARAVMDATSVLLLQERLRGSHEQYFAKFSLATRLLTGAGGPTLWLSDLDPLAATALESAIDGQVALLHVVRASVEKIKSHEARLLSASLSEEELQQTIFSELRSRYRLQLPSLEALDRGLGIVPFGRLALEMACDLFVQGSSPHTEDLLTAAKKVTIAGDASYIFIGLGPLNEAIGAVGGADVDPTDAVECLEGAIARHGTIPFTGKKSDKSELSWREFAAQLSADKLRRKKRSGVRLTMDDLHDLLASLRDFNLASARLRDVLDAAGCAASLSREPVFLVRGAGADANNP